MKKVLLLVCLFIGLYFSARILLVWDKPNSDMETRVSVSIPRGTSLQGISEVLYDYELIRDPWVFRLFVKKQGLANKLQAGDYVIQKNLTFAEITEILQSAKSEEIRVTIPEGSTIKQIDEILTKKSLIEKGEFTKCTSFCNLGFSISNLEGFLFPSTYFVDPKNFSEKKFIQRLYREFEKQIEPFQKDILESGRTLNEIIIIASMVEREANSDAEMAKVSDVIWKRLDARMHLGIDATTRYELNDWKRGLLTEDFQSDSPYNTRRKIGLPPTAISNPGLPAIKAAIFPEKTEYWYYLHDRKGQVHFSKDLEEHNRYKAQYLN